jgi:hypothetical protein
VRIGPADPLLFGGSVGRAVIAQCKDASPW